MADKLIGFIYFIDNNDIAEYYGVAVEDGKVVEWQACENWDHRGSNTANYFDMLVKYDGPTFFDDYDYDEEDSAIWDRFEKKCDELLAAAKKEAATWTN